MDIKKQNPYFLKQGFCQVTIFFVTSHYINKIMMAKLHFISDMSKQIVLFPHRMDEKIAANDPVRVLDSLRERKGKRGYLTN